MKSLLVVVVLATTAAAEPCPQLGLVPEVMRPTAEVAADGGVVIMEVSKMVDRVVDPDLSTWRVSGRTLVATPLAPGLYVVPPPPGATKFTVEDRGKVKGTATLLAKPPARLGPPAIKAIESGETTAKHVTRYVTVQLATAAPKGAIALVLRDAKGTPLSWGTTGDSADRVVVYSTQGGCVRRFPDGTQIAQPGDKVVATWVDATGRTSSASSPVVVRKP